MRIGLWSAAMLAATAAAARVLTERPDPLVYVAVMAGPFLVYLAAAVDVLAGRCRSGLAWILLGGVGMGIALATCPPLFENDFQRYEWDARVWAAGVNPYAYPPSDPALASLRGPDFDAIGYPAVPTCYPPVAELEFRAAVAAADALGVPALRGFQALDLLLAAGITLLLWSLLRDAGLPRERAALWGICPLVAREFGNSGHVDALAVFLVTAALAAAVRRRPWWSGVLVGMAVDVKAYPLILVPFLFRLLNRADATRAAAATAITALAAFAPFVSAGPQLWAGLAAYAAHWRFNAPLFGVLSALAGGAARPVAAALLVLALTLRLVWRRGGPADLPAVAADCVFALGALLLLSPVFDPWYLTWMLPFLVLSPSPPWLAMTGLVNASYLFYLTLQPSGAITALEFVPFAALAAWEIGRRVRRGNQASPRPIVEDPGIERRMA